MAYPQDVGAVDLMIGFPFRDKKAVYRYLQKGLKDAQSNDQFVMPAEYMFKGIPDEAEADSDPIATTFEQMDRFHVDIGLFGLGPQSLEAKERFPGRVALSLEADPNEGMTAVRRIKQAHADHGLNAVTMFPSGYLPQVAVNDPRMYPIYAACVELDIPVIVNAGIAGPRFPSAVQDVMHFDEVCYDFPDLRIVMRHGAEPWTALAVKLMLKWPGLHYMPSAFAPKHYPKDIIAFANTRGSDKVMYAGYYPMGLSLERIFTELANVPLKDDVWPKFLRDNALRVFKLTPPS
jgi:predicted TIM-barrel fold metal-dependent hydrolase